MAKLNKNTILDGIGKLQSTNELTWDEIKDKHNVDMSTGEMRKRIHGILDYIDAFDEIDNEQLIEIKKEKINLMDLRTDINRKIRQYAKIENIVENIKQECRDINDFQFVDTDKVELYENGHTALIMITDIHYNGNPKIIDRFNKVIDYTINKCQINSVNKLIVFLGGDLINNEHRTTVRIENRENVSYQIVNVAKLVSEGLLKLAKHIPYVCVANVQGNHCRSISDYKDAMSTDSYLPILRELIQLRLEKIHNIVFLENVEGDDRFCVLDICNKTYVLTHGDVLKGLKKNSITEIEGYLDTKIDVLLIGHFHKLDESMHFSKRTIVNGSFYNAFDYSKKAIMNTPCYQRLLMIDDSGDVECIYDIKLD